MGDLGSILIRAKRFDRLPAILVQLQIWMQVAKENFPDGTPQLKSLQHMYDYLVDNMKHSGDIVVMNKKGSDLDLEQLEITHAAEKGEREVTVKDVTEQLKKVEGKAATGWFQKPSL